MIRSFCFLMVVAAVMVAPSVAESQVSEPDLQIARAVLPADSTVDLPKGATDAALLRAAVLGCYDVRTDDRCLRRLQELAAEERPRYFDRLRKEYPVRREFAATRLTGADVSGKLREQLSGLGFAV